MTNNDIYYARSYAKINLGLHILNKLPTGYHELETGFCFLDWYDTIEVKKREKKDVLHCNVEGIPVDENNLIIRALNHLRKYINVDTYFDITLSKRIPAGAGLGGGSSNAATILRVVNKMCDLKLTTADLTSLSSGLGADIPLFIEGKTGIARGIGTDITFQDLQPEYWIVTVFPDIHSSTPEAYRLCTPDPNREFELDRILMQEPVEEWPYLLQNDLEQPVIYQHKLIGDLKDHFYEAGSVYASMSGSGSAVFGLFEQEFVALDAYKELIAHSFRANITASAFRPDWTIYVKS